MRTIAFRERRYFNPAPRAHYRPDFARYEVLKSQWVTDNPKATHEEYQIAMRKIADQCKI